MGRLPSPFPPFFLVSIGLVPLPNLQVESRGRELAERMRPGGGRSVFVLFDDRPSNADTHLSSPREYFRGGADPGPKVVRL